MSWFSIQGPNISLRAEVGLPLLESGFPVWKSPVYPGGSSLLVLKLARERGAWLRSWVARRGRYSVSEVSSDPDGYLTPFRVQHVALHAPIVPQSTALHLARERILGEQLYRFPDPGLGITKRILERGVAALYLFSVTGGDPLVYVPGSLALRRALTGRGVALVPAKGLPSYDYANRLSLWEQDHWRIYLVPPYAHNILQQLNDPLSYTLSPKSHADLFQDGEAFHLTEDVFVWRYPITGHISREEVRASQDAQSRSRQRTVQREIARPTRHPRRAQVARANERCAATA